jgi:FkbM family methyltransferase
MGVNHLTVAETQPPRWKPKNFRNTIVDVGMHDGADTAFYLHQGYAVLAVEADPALAAAAAQRFADAIQVGQLHILNVGIADKTSTATFWICEDNSVWNSFDVRIASRNGSRHHPIRIETWRFADVLRIFGVPEYLKIDIEGADSHCVNDLDRKNLPRFISVESECVGDGQTLAPDEAVRMLELLCDAGYSRFKLVSQDDFRTMTYPDRWRFVRLLIDSAARGKLSRVGFRRVAERVSTRGKLESLNGGYRFDCGSTGPWGPGLLGRWLSYQQARATYLGVREQFFAKTDVKTYAFWYDWHATV